MSQDQRNMKSCPKQMEGNVKRSSKRKPPPQQKRENPMTGKRGTSSLRAASSGERPGHHLRLLLRQELRELAALAEQLLHLTPDRVASRESRVASRESRVASRDRVDRDRKNDRSTARPLHFRGPPWMGLGKVSNPRGKLILWSISTSSQLGGLGPHGLIFLLGEARLPSLEGSLTIPTVWARWRVKKPRRGGRAGFRVWKFVAKYRKGNPMTCFAGLFLGHSDKVAGINQLCGLGVVCASSLPSM